MDSKSEIYKIGRQLEQLRRERPDVYELILDVAQLPDDKYKEFMKQAMPLFRKYLN